MPTNALDNILPGPELDALTAQKVFGWKNVHKHDGALVGKKQDKAGRWRTAKVPQHSTEPVNAYTIDERMKHSVSVLLRSLGGGASVRPHHPPEPLRQEITLPRRIEPLLHHSSPLEAVSTAKSRIRGQM